MHCEVIDDDFVDRRAEERRQFQVQTLNMVPAFKVMKVAGYDIGCEVRSLSRSAKACTFAPAMSPTKRTLFGPNVITPADFKGPETAAEPLLANERPTAEAAVSCNTSRLEQARDIALSFMKLRVLLLTALPSQR